jgi:hypothetical protein
LKLSVSRTISKHGYWHQLEDYNYTTLRASIGIKQVYNPPLNYALLLSSNLFNKLERRANEACFALAVYPAYQLVRESATNTLYHDWTPYSYA